MRFVWLLVVVMLAACGDSSGGGSSGGDGDGDGDGDLERSADARAYCEMGCRCVDLDDEECIGECADVVEETRKNAAAAGCLREIDNQIACVRFAYDECADLDFDGGEDASKLCPDEADELTACASRD